MIHRRSPEIKTNAYLFIWRIILCWFLSGCVSDYDCPEGKECDESKQECTPLTCKNITGKLGGNIKPKESFEYFKWFIGDVAEYCCEDGNYLFPFINVIII